MITPIYYQGIARRKIVGGNLLGNFISLAGKTKGALLGATKNAVRAILKGAPGRVKALARAVGNSALEAGRSALEDQLSPENVRGLVSDLASGRASAAAKRLKSAARSTATAAGKAARSTAATRLQKERTKLSAEARQRLNALVGSSEAQKALVSRAQNIARRNISAQNYGSYSSGKKMTFKIGLCTRCESFP